MDGLTSFLVPAHCEALRDFFQADLSAIRLRISRLPAAFHRLTLTEGNTIHVARGAIALDAEARARLVAREIARIVLVRASGASQQGLAALVETERREAEIERVADLFARAIGPLAERSPHAESVADAPRRDAVA